MKATSLLALALLLLHPDPARADAPHAPPHASPAAPPHARPDAPHAHAITVRIALALDADGDHVTFRTQNGSKVSLAKHDLVGKPVLIALTHGGEPVANSTPIDVATVPLGADLTARFTTPARYSDGAWEVSCVIQLSPSERIPAPGDLAAFDNTPPPAGEDPPTGVSVRVHVRGADAAVTLGNHYFIRFAA